MSNSKHFFNFNWILEECQILLSLQEMDLERWEVKLAEEQARNLHSFDGLNLSMDLEELHVCMTGVEDECTVEAVELSQLVMEISNALVDLQTFPYPRMPPRGACL
jgi:hypothetical protein